MMIRNTFRFLFLGFGLALATACSDDDEVVPVDTELPEVHVALSVGPEPMEGEVGTRATSPRVPDVENLIYDLWVLQYMQEKSFATLVKSVHLNADATSGVTSYEAQDLALYAVDSYICVIVNRNPGESSAQFKDIFDNETDALKAEIFSNFRSTLVTVPIARINDGSEDKILMCGYWEGTPTEGASINVMLGRMIARLNITLENQSSVAFITSTVNKKKYDRRLNVQLTNVPTKTYLFPSVDANALDYKDTTNYTTLSDDQVTIKAPTSTTNYSSNLYYYVAPNYCNSESGATKIILSYNNNNSSEDVDNKTATIVLGTDAPGTSNRDLNLYHNTIYNFTITLTDPE